MSEKNTGGPAFPTDQNMYRRHGMTLRDYFAAKAMQAMLISFPKPFDADEISTMAYDMASSMLKERAKQ